MTTSELIRKPGHRAAVAVTLLIAVAGCGSPEPEEKLEKSAEQVHEAEEARAEQKEQIAEIRDELKDKQAEVRDTEKQLGEARQQLAEAQQRVDGAQQQLDSHATDVALFRRIQSELLDDDQLSEAAVSVRVEDGVVTLDGTVTGEEELERAIEIAKGSPGVTRVESEIEVRQEPAAAGDQPAQSAEETPAEATPVAERERL